MTNQSNLCVYSGVVLCCAVLCWLTRWRCSFICFLICINMANRKSMMKWKWKCIWKRISPSYERIPVSVLELGKRNPNGDYDTSVWPIDRSNRWQFFTAQISNYLQQSYSGTAKCSIEHACEIKKSSQAPNMNKSHQDYSDVVIRA